MLKMNKIKRETVTRCVCVCERERERVKTEINGKRMRMRKNSMTEENTNKRKGFTEMTDTDSELGRYLVWFLFLIAYQPL